MSQKCLNRWSGIGLVGKDAELRRTPKGIAVCNLSLACSRSWKDASGEKQTRTDWIPCVAWDRLAEMVSQYVKKGDLVFVEGALQFTEKDREGVRYNQGEITMTDIIFLKSKVTYDRGESQPQFKVKAPVSLLDIVKGSGPPVDDSEIPF